MTGMMAAILCSGVLSAAPVETRARDARKVLRQAREEAVQISPYLEKALPWGRMERNLANSATPPAPWLARGFVLCAAFYLEGWPADQQIKLLRGYLSDESRVVRLLVVQMLAREPMVAAGSLTDLRKAARDADDRVRLVVARFLMTRGDDPAAFDALLGYLRSADGSIRAEAVSLLNDVARERWGWPTREAALPRSLGLTAERKAVLLQALKSAERPVRWTAAEIIGMSGDVSLSAALMKTAAAETEGGRPARTCYRALGYLGSEKAIPFLLKAIERPHGGGKTGRTAPAEALVLLGRREAIPGLVGLLAKRALSRAALHGLTVAFDPDVAPAGKYLVPSAEGALEARHVPDSDVGAVRAAWESFVKKRLDRVVWKKDRRLFVVIVVDPQ